MKRKSTSSRSTTKRRKVKRDAITTQDVVRIAKSVVHRSAETKSYVRYVSATPLDNVCYAINVIGRIGQGNSSETVIGEKMYMKNLRVRGFTYSNNATFTTKQLRILVIRTKQQLTTTEAVISGLTDVFRTGTTTLTPVAHIDLHKSDVLYDNIWSITPRTGSVTPNTETVPFEFNVPINRTEYFDSDNGTYLKDKTYYILVCPYESSGVTNPLGVQIAYATNWKDE